MEPDPAVASWLVHALASLSEGICPNHALPLPVSGWCQECQVWWSADFQVQSTNAHYPVPNYDSEGNWLGPYLAEPPDLLPR